jgi:hypothetical protein
LHAFYLTPGFIKNIWNHNVTNETLTLFLNLQFLTFEVNFRRPKDKFLNVNPNEFFRFNFFNNHSVRY